MALHIYWGEDDFALLQAIEALKQETLDPTWESFNFERIPPDHPEGAIHALTQAMTPPFGMGKRLIWLDNPPLLQQCSEDLYQELERTLPQLPDSTELLMSSG
ncbi:MAG: DNA polymerase III subunit delta, partial [Prochlorothrix sp.]